MQGNRKGHSISALFSLYDRVEDICQFLLNEQYCSINWIKRTEIKLVDFISVLNRIVW